MEWPSGGIQKIFECGSGVHICTEDGNLGVISM